MKNLRLSEVSGLGGSARADYKTFDTCFLDTWVTSGVFKTPFSASGPLFSSTALSFLIFFFQNWNSARIITSPHLLFSSLTIWARLEVVFRFCTACGAHRRQFCGVPSNFQEKLQQQKCSRRLHLFTAARYWRHDATTLFLYFSESVYYLFNLFVI